MVRGLEENTIQLCLFCSASQPSPAPRATLPPFLTSCCAKPICEPCLSRNPRLAKYNPCLSCLSGVDVVRAGRDLRLQTGPERQSRVNIDGATIDSDLFVIGDGDGDNGSDDDDDASSVTAETEREFDGSNLGSSASRPGSEYCRNRSPSVASLEKSSDNRSISSISDVSSAPTWSSSASLGSGVPFAHTSEEADHSQRPRPEQYYIQPKDTLNGIALKFGIDAKKLCVLNKLPFSAVTSTPHLLHTRTILELPPGVKSTSPPTRADLEEIERKRAAKRLQILVKESDWTVAQTYVHLAEMSPVEGELEKQEDWDKERLRERKGTRRKQSSSLTERAVDSYLDDDEWEKDMAAHGLRPADGIQRFPHFAGSSQQVDCLRIGRKE